MKKDYTKKQMDKLYEVGWKSGYDSAIQDVMELLIDNSRLFAPSTYKTFVTRVSEKMLSHNDETKKNFMAILLGRLGGEMTFKKYGKDQMKEWGKKGGRPKKVAKK